MKKITIFVVSTIISNFSLADFEIPNQFEDGQVTSASQMNENFQALKAELEAQRALIEANLGNQKVVFQGFSAQSMNGAAGLLAMQQACHNLVAGSHVCKDTEIALSPYNPNAQNLEGQAWVIADVGAAVHDQNSSRVTLISPLSLFDHNDSYNSGRLVESCKGWTSFHSPNRGAVATSELGITTSGCQFEQKVACCK